MGRSRRSYEKAVIDTKRVMKYSGKLHLPVSEVTVRDLTTFARDHPKLKVVTVANYISKALRFLNWCVDQEYLKKNPAKGFRVNPEWFPPQSQVPKKKKIYLPEEVAEIVESIQSLEWKCIVLLSYETGMRIGDVVGLSKHHLDKEDNTLLVRTKKVDDTFVNPGISQELVDMLTELEEDGREVYFPEELAIYTDPRSPDGVGCAHLCHELKRLCKAAGQPYYGFHAFRRTYVTHNAHRFGVDAVSKAIGHKNTTTTMGYVVGSTEQPKNIVQFKDLLNEHTKQRAKGSD